MAGNICHPPHQCNFHASGSKTIDMYMVNYCTEECMVEVKHGEGFFGILTLIYERQKIWAYLISQEPALCSARQAIINHKSFALY